jgi:hypothetical protein
LKVPKPKRPPSLVVGFMRYIRKYVNAKYPAAARHMVVV